MKSRTIVLFVAILAVVVSAPTFKAYSQATTATYNITFLVRGNVQVIPTGGTDPGDILIVTAFLGTTDATGCGVSPDNPIQDAVVVDQGGGRATRLSQIIVTSQTTAIKPGTKFTDLVGGGACSVNAIAYQIYTARVVE